MLISFCKLTFTFSFRRLVKAVLKVLVDRLWFYSLEKGGFHVELLVESLLSTLILLFVYNCAKDLDPLKLVYASIPTSDTRA